MSFISTYKLHLKYKFLISILVGLVYAISDEIHQGFTPGRTPSPIDVGIDTCGVMFGIIVVLIIISVYKALTEKNIDIMSMNTRTNKQGLATMATTFEISNREELNRIIDKIRSIDSVIDIERTTG